MKDKKLELEVIESLQEDIDKGIVRISSENMQLLNLVSGDLIEIKGKSSIIVKVMRIFDKNISENKIGLDGTTRSNISASIGELISVSKAEVQSAKSITLSPLQEGIRFSDNPTEYFHSKLMDKPLVLNQFQMKFIQAKCVLLESLMRILAV